MATAFTSVKILEAEFITLNSSYLENGMFPIKSETSDPFFDLHAIATDESKIETLISEWSDDISFGKIYAIIGSFTFKEICGHLVVLAPDVVRECFKSPLSLQLICFSSKTVKCKISRRTKSSAAVLKKVSEILTFNLYQKTMTFLPNRINCSNPGREFIMSSWNSEFGTEPAILNGLDTSKILKRKHVAFLSKESAMNLIDSTDYFIPGPTLNQSKRLKTILEENSTSFSDTNYKKENKSKINLREEATSLVEGAFSHKWSPEKFVEGFHALKNKCLESKSQLAATVASVLMDASYRITDCTPIMEDDVITDVAIDVDQVGFYFLLLPIH